MARTTKGRAGTPRRIDFHSHSFLTDGSTSPTDMWTAAEALEHRALALTDHLSMEDPKPLLRRLHAEARAWEGEAFLPLVGVELTQLPPTRIRAVARAARRAGAEIVIVHGETLADIVPPGTNHAAIESGEVDVLAHPGLIAPADARMAHDNGVLLEISGRRGHSLANGHVVRVALEAGAELVVDSDAHGTDQLIPWAMAQRIARGAGVPEATVENVLSATPARLVRRIRGR